MSIKKASPPTAAQASIHERLTVAAQAFAEEIVRVLSEATLAELTQLGGDAARRRGPGRPPRERSGIEAILLREVLGAQALLGRADERQRPPAQLSSIRRFAGTKPVDCPAPGCSSPGIRSKMNFCAEHFRSLTQEERVRLRRTQRERRDGARQAPRGHTASG